MEQNKVKILILYVFIFSLISCREENVIDNINLEILNSELVSYSDNIQIDTINIIRFSIKNNSDEIYFINGSGISNYKLEGINKLGITLKVFDSNDKEIKYFTGRQPKIKNSESILDFINNYDIHKNKYLGYKNLQYNYFKMNNIDKSFFLFPEQTLCFEYPLCLSKLLPFDEDRNNYVRLNKDTKYYAKIFMNSEASLYKSNLPWDVLKSIEINNAKVFDGLIESTNKVDVRIIE